MWHQLKQFVIQKPQFFIGLLLFSVALFVYMANDRHAATSDTLPNSILALNWLRNNTFNFDAFRSNYQELPWFLVEAPNGHLTSTYPIGTAIVTFPIYFLFSLYIKFTNLIHTDSFSFPIDFPNIADPAFNEIRLQFQKLAAAIATAFSVVIFYQATRIKFSSAIALITTFIFAFCTLTWVISSQLLWQHTASNLVLITAILALLKVDRTLGNLKGYLLIAAGFFCGLLPGVRPTGALFSIVLFLYVATTYSKQIHWFCLGATSIFFNLAWNFYYFGFGNLIGGYSNQFSTGQSGYELTIPYFLEAFTGLTISPSRGLIIVSPILLFSIPGMFYVIRNRSRPDEKLIAGLAIASLILFLQYCVYKPWFGRAPVNFGPRFLTDLLPVVAYLVNYPAACLLEKFKLPHPINSPISAKQKIQPKALYRRVFALNMIKWKKFILLLFITSTLYSAFAQIAGAFGNQTSWELIPFAHSYRLWDWHDSELQRSTRSLFYEITNPIGSQKQYHTQLAGVIEQITDRNNRPILIGLEAPAGKKRYFKARLRNTGKVDWFGYETGMKQGITQVKVTLFDQNNKPISNFKPGTLYVSGNHRPGTQAEAIGLIAIPEQADNYQLHFNLSSGEIGDFPQTADYLLNLIVK